MSERERALGVRGKKGVFDPTARLADPTVAARVKASQAAAREATVELQARAKLDPTIAEDFQAKEKFAQEQQESLVRDPRFIREELASIKTFKKTRKRAREIEVGLFTEFQETVTPREEKQRELSLERGFEGTPEELAIAAEEELVAAGFEPEEFDRPFSEMGGVAEASKRAVSRVRPDLVPVEEGVRWTLADLFPTETRPIVAVLLMGGAISIIVGMGRGGDKRRKG